MLPSESSFSFKENMLTRVFVCFFFGLAAGILATAAFLKLRDGLVWLILAVAASALMLSLFYLIFSSLRTARTVLVTPEGIAVRSRDEGEKYLAWREVQQVKEVQTRIEKVRSAAPLIEVMLSLYLNLPFMGGLERRGQIVIDGGVRGQIIIRQHLVYPHRLVQLQEAADRYVFSRATPMFLHLSKN